MSQFFRRLIFSPDLLLSGLPLDGHTFRLILLLPQASVAEVEDGSSDISTRQLLGNDSWLYGCVNPSCAEYARDRRWYVIFC